MLEDPIAGGTSTDRVHYATGVLLDAEDFRDEQSYHRGRLARALAYLHGSGTIAGLRVEVRTAADDPDETLIVHPGLALDRIGRLIEMPRPRCIRLRRWFDAEAAQRADELTQAFNTDASVLLSAVARDGLAALPGFVVDLFVSFHNCPRGKTPAFAAGPFDATDAAQPARLRDAAQFELRPRIEALTETEPKLPRNDWPDLAGAADAQGRRRLLQDKLLANWREGSDARDAAGLEPDVEHLAVQDHSAVFVARLVLPGAAASPPTRAAGAVVVDNHARRFVYPTPAAQRLFGI